MKTLFPQANRLRVALAAVLTLAFLPLTSTWSVSEAQPPRYAPAYGYRRKVTRNRVYRRYERPSYRRESRRSYKRSYRPAPRRFDNRPHRPYYRSPRNYR